MATRTKMIPSVSVDETAGPSCTRVLVTGANAGLGLDTCRRLIDEFLLHRPSEQSLHLLITTRSAAKSSATIRRLEQHTSTTHPSVKPNTPDSRLRITAYELDLTHLPSVVKAARAINQSIPGLDALICNAGMTGWTHVDYPKAIWRTTTSPIQEVTFPTYMVAGIGWKTKPQLPPDTGLEEPPLGEVFCANVFGHYVLAHELRALLRKGSDGGSRHPGRLIWISSLMGQWEDLNIEDIQGLGSDNPYVTSKRLMDVLALTATLKPCRKYVEQFWGNDQAPGQIPRLYTCHPGVAATGIVPMHPILAYMQLARFFMVRLLGSPWHTISSYKGAVAPVWLGLSPQATLDTLEEKEGVGKWGSATDLFGNERVMRTEVEGWGWGGVVEKVVLGEKRKGRSKYARDLTEKQLEDFEILGAECWKQMEQLRLKWEGLMKEAGVM